MMVEFIGAAGVGKSYLSDRVLEILKERGLPARNFNCVNKRRVGARSLVLLAKAIRLAILTRQKTAASLWKAVDIIWKYSIRREVCDQLPGMHVTSEGLFHKIISFHRKSAGLGMDQLADILFRQIAPPDAVVVVEASVETIFARRSSRNRSNDVFCPGSVREDVEMVRESVRAMEHVRRTLNPNLQILRIAADEEKGDAPIAAIVAFLEPFTCTPQPVSRVRV